MGRKRVLLTHLLKKVWYNISSVPESLYIYFTNIGFGVMESGDNGICVRI